MTWGSGIMIAFCLGVAFGCCLILLVGEIEQFVHARRAALALAEAEELRRLRELGPDHWRASVTSQDGEAIDAEAGEAR